MTYNVFGATLSLTQINQSLVAVSTVVLPWQGCDHFFLICVSAGYIFFLAATILNISI